MNPPTSTRVPARLETRAEVRAGQFPPADAPGATGLTGSTGTIGLPPGPVTSAELAAAVPDARDRRRYRRIWHGMYRREDQVDDLALRTAALACAWPDGGLRGRSAALLGAAATTRRRQTRPRRGGSGRPDAPRPAACTATGSCRARRPRRSADSA